MRRTRALALVTMVAAATLTTAACSSASGTTTGSTAPATTAASIAGPVMTISGFAFSTLSVKAGATVTVKNMDSVNHTVKVGGTSVDVTVPAAGQATFTAPAKPGTYPLSCDLHPHMHGTLTVTA